MGARNVSTFKGATPESTAPVDLAERRALRSARAIILALMTPQAPFPTPAMLMAAWRDMLALDRQTSARDMWARARDEGTVGRAKAGDIAGHLDQRAGCVSSLTPYLSNPTGAVAPCERHDRMPRQIGERRVGDGDADPAGDWARRVGAVLTAASTGNLS